MNKLKYLLCTAILTVFSSLSYGQVCDPNDQACLPAPTGLLTGNVKVGSFFTTINGLIIIVCAIVCIKSLITMGSNLENGRVKESIGPFFGAAVGGLSAFIAYSFIN
jgi:hypothetical protein